MVDSPPIYAIPGLGMKPVIFERLSLDYGPIRPMEWIEPQDQAETFGHYCLRMSEQIDHHGPVVIMGMSFGGLVAQRLTRMLPNATLVVISSLKSSDEKPPWVHLFRQLSMHRLQHRWGRNSTMRLWAPRFGIDTPALIDFCRPMFNAHSDLYFQWSVQKITHWENLRDPHHALHLQGDADKIFPIEYLKPEVTSIPGGDHFMVYKRAEELGPLIDAHLNNLVDPVARLVDG